MVTLTSLEGAICNRSGKLTDEARVNGFKRDSFATVTMMSVMAVDMQQNI